VLADAPTGKPEVILIASGSELSLAVEAHEQLRGEGVGSRVVSMPSWELFDDQPREDQVSFLPPEVTARVAVEQGSTIGWERYVGPRGHVVGRRRSAPAPLKALQTKFGFEPERAASPGPPPRENPRARPLRRTREGTTGSRVRRERWVD
jgi:transketolase